MGRLREGRSALIERTEELARLEAVCASVLGGAGEFVVIEGPPGIGKTVLLDAARDAGQRAGFRVLTAQGHPIESGLSFGVARQLFERRVAAMSQQERGDALRGAAGLATSVIGSVDGAETSLFPAMHGLFWLTANLADAHPVMIVVDDAHWADDASLRWLAYMTKRLEDVRVAVLLARWPHVVGPVSPTLDALTNDRNAERITVRELTRSGVAELARGIRGADVDGAFVEQLHERTGGNPFFVRALVLADDHGTDRVVPASVVRFAAGRLRSLTQSAQDLAEAAAVLGSDVDLATAAGLLGMVAEVAESAQDELARSHVIAVGPSLTFAHPLVREAVYTDLPAGRKAHLHRRAASVLADLNRDVEHVAVHLMSATPSGDCGVVSTLRSAAGRARSRGDNQAAAAYLTRARAEVREPDHEVLLELGVALSLWNPAAAVEPLEAAMAAAPDADARLLVAMELAQAVFRQANLTRAYDVLEAALADDLTRTDPDLVLAVEGGLLTTGGLAPQLVARSRQRLETLAVPRGDTPGERLLLSGMARVRLTVPEPWGDLVDVVRRAAGGGKILTDHAPDAGTFSTVVWPLMVEGHFAEASELIESFFADAARRGSLVNVALSTHLNGVLSVLKGDMNAALEYTGQAIELSLASGYLVVLPTAVAFRIRALIQAGRCDDAEALLIAYGFDGAVQDVAIQFHTLLRARAELRLAQGRADEAWADLQDLAARHEASYIDEETLGWRPLGVDALVALARRDDAEGVARDEVARARAKGMRPAEARALVALGWLIGGNEGLANLRAGVTLMETMAFDLDRAHALATLGRALIRRNARAEAQPPLLEALDLATRLGASVLADQLMADLRSTGARPRRTALTGVDALTSAERRVADLAARGCSNAVIAQQLFVTRKNVEYHLTNVYRKLQVTSRHELGVVLAG